MNMIEDFPYSTLLDDLTAEEQELLMACGSKTELEKNQVVFSPGSPATKVYIVLKGRVRIYNSSEEEKEVLKNLIHEGEIFGESAIFGEKVRLDYTAAMDEDVSLLEITIADITRLMNENPGISFKISSQVVQKLRAAEKRLEALTFKNSRTRIIEFLKDTAIKQGRQVGYETLLRPFLTHQDIGNLTTTSRQTVSSVLNELKGSNKIYYDRYRLLIRDLSVL